MKKIDRILLMILLSALIFSCTEEAELLDESIIHVTETSETDLDQWIYENITQPYNVEVIWKWDDRSVGDDERVIPPTTEKAKEFLEAYLNTWIKPYEIVAGEEFIKSYGFKQLVLVGSPSYNADGTVTLGYAEGGRKVVCMDVNSFDSSNKSRICADFHTMHHEFGHILNQLKFVTPEFKNISGQYYTSNWNLISGTEANEKGFITPYSMLNENEDFVELASGMTERCGQIEIITETDGNGNEIPVDSLKYTVPLKNSSGEIVVDEETGSIEPGSEPNYVVYNNVVMVEKAMSQWEHFLYMFGYSVSGNNVTQNTTITEEGLPDMLKKIEIVKDYYLMSWGIDMDELQREIDLAINAYINENEETEN